MRQNSDKLMELGAQVASEQDSQKLMALIEQLNALLDAEERLSRKDLERLGSEQTD